MKNRINLFFLLFITLLSAFTPGLAQVKTLGNPNSIVYGLALTQGGSLLAATEKNRINLFNISSGKAIKTYEDVHTQLVLSIDISQDSSKIISGGTDGLAVLWDLKEGKPLKVIQHPAPITVARFVPHKNLFVFGGSDGQIIIYDYKTGEERAKLKLHTEEITALAISPDGKIAASADVGRNTYLWDVQNGRILKPLPKAGGWIRDLSFNESGETLFSVGDNARLTYHHMKDSTLEFHKMKRRYGWILSLDQMTNSDGDEIVAFSRLSGLVQVITPEGGYEYKAKRLVQQLKLVPQQGHLIVLALATRGRGVLILKGIDMEVKP